MNDIQLPCPLILASSSPYRAELLSRLGLPFAQISPAVDESPHSGEQGEALALRLARAKAAAVADAHPDAVVIGSDQVPVCNDQLLKKPGARLPAIAQLRACSGQQIIFHTALAICRGTVCHSLSVPTRVVMRRLTDARIERYVDTDRPFDCAGGMKSESLGISLAESITSDDPTALIGLPLTRVVALLARFGIDLP